MTTPCPAPHHWLSAAWVELGEREGAGPADNARIVELFTDAGHPDVRSDSVAWCAAFVGAALARSGIPPTGSLRARSYLDWGHPLSVSRTGAIAVFSRGSDPAAGHVGFVVGETSGSLIVLGGNQANAVTVELQPRSRLLGLRWPTPTDFTAPPITTVDGHIFQQSLAHVLEMEGGYTDDPADPGGPTYRGVTLTDLAAIRGTAVTADNREQLITDLRKLSKLQLEEIYRDLYWTPAGCSALPPPIALFHFDTAVNMGVGTAIRMLQTAVGVVVDGEIGPQTLNAASAARSTTLVAAYAELRRRRYRGLATFPRFGRGWLARVDRTIARSSALQQTSTSSNARKGPQPMTDARTSNSTETKWWGHSLTVWGAVVAGLSAILPALGPAVGVEIPAQTVTQSAEQIGAIVQAATGLAGTLLAIFGRIRASQPLARRPLTLHL